MLQKVFCPPFSIIEKFAWRIKCALGFTALVSIAVSRMMFQGWVVVPYSFAIALTSEGAVKKRLFCMFGAAIGRFNAYLALTASGEIGDAIFGLIAWITASTFFAAYCGLQT
eukprot:13621080-Ditylum_brightwellii.AAC.1